MLPDLPDLPSIYAAGPLAPRVIAGVAGLLLLLAGRRLYRAAIVLPGLLLGLGAGIVAGGLLGAVPMVVAGLAIAGGVIGALLAAYAERLAVVIAGVLAGLGALQVGWPLAASGAPSWWAWPLAAIVGAAVFPFVWRAALVPLTAWIGAVVLVDVAGLPPSPLAVGGLALFGVIVQLASGRKRQPEER
ncbi:MAG: hypothetical protein Q8P18_24990 [Pseudomonadota bacterium]|nr:hypothetical protein [Pseudomonadota bacterium]